MAKSAAKVVVTYTLERAADASFKIKAWLPIEVSKPLPKSAIFEDSDGAKCISALGGGAAIGTGADRRRVVPDAIRGP